MLERKQTYDEFIQNIKESRENKWFEHSERHHIIPRCIGGTDEEDNLIYLTYREHFIAHKLLHEENPSNPLLLLAYHLMCNTRDCCTPEEYERSKMAYAEYKSRSMIGNTISKGITPTKEARLHMSESQRGRRHTEETKRKISEANLGRKVSEESRENMRRSQASYVQSHLSEMQERGRRLAEYNIGRHHKEETKEKIRKSQIGEKNSFYGKHHTLESLEKIRKSSLRRDYDRVCRLCGCHFLGGSSAKYCPTCKSK